MIVSGDGGGRVGEALWVTGKAAMIKRHRIVGVYLIVFILSLI